MLLILAINRVKCFRADSYAPKTYNIKRNNSVRIHKSDVYHPLKLGALISNPEEFKLIPNYLHYEKLTNFIPDRVELLHKLKKSLSRYRKVTLKVIGKLRCKTLPTLRRCYEDLLDEVKFWYLKGSNFSFYDLFTLGDNPVYLLTKLNLLVFIVDIFLKGQLKRNFSVEGLNLFYKNEHYRILTSLFVHSDLRHLLSNLGGLLSVGNNVLKLYGPANLVLIYFTAGLLGNYISYMYNYVYKNGIPANLLLILRSIGRNFSSATKPIVTATNTIVDDILQKSRRVGFPVFMFDYLFTTASMAFDFLLSKLVQVVTGVSPGSPNDVDMKVKEICMTRSRTDYKTCGASSGIFGLHGALLTYYIKSGYINNYTAMNNLFVSFAVPYIIGSFTHKIDHVSHAVGFLIGSALSAMLD
ncbi:uncharacterized protein TOT_030000117 [Theileria orientalis strain Shintoku]|uniref:Peptidase S54 rhomboid domain-containing protein n=1 Tax=Theileria orientalis strain Shintoku TaxID=869250 RepID=J4D8M0_THEOR|nr:uncharacterized protein TOT_030000117 [Theileria orientalis strain Shintoku]PVC53474.1 hypothetical protein MACL_00000052 [Theileria orientalis]BAM40855.1 uncharacterized protein TOT_030000117 [Theileria orientalis strain Shintoku]|eukprot:XP_009691156.1 uncharacterized protein TOT_030000117 [Theileria orientalis strain Shintoku]